MQLSVLRRHPRLDAKRALIDIQSIIQSSDQLTLVWNDFVRCNEISTLDSNLMLNEAGNRAKKGRSGKFYCLLKKEISCECGDDICGPDYGCNCKSCHKLDKESQIFQSFHKKYVSSRNLLNSWTWIDQPTVNELQSCLNSLLNEQLEQCIIASTASISMIELKQLLLILKRFYIAVDHSNQVCIKKNDFNEVFDNKIIINDTYLNNSKRSENTEDIMLNNLTKIGLNTALNFAFAFLRKSWQSKDDAILCNVLLSELLNSIQTLPIDGLFQFDKLPHLWLESISRIEIFLKQIVLDEFESSNTYRIPIEDKRLVLSILLELSLQKAHLNSIIEFVIMLLNLWHLNFNKKLKNNTNNLTEAQFIVSLQRLTMFENDKSFDKKNVIGSFLYFNKLPVNTDISICLNWSAAYLMCQLSRLCYPLLKHYSKSGLNWKQNIISLGWNFRCNEFFDETNSSKQQIIKIKQIVCAKTCFLILSDCGIVYSMNYDCMTCIPERISGFGDKKIIELASNIEATHFLARTECCKIYSWGNGDGGKLGHGDVNNRKDPTLIHDLIDKNIVFIACGSNYSAAVSNIGILFTWGSAAYCRLGHGLIDDCLYPTPVTELVDYHVTHVACGFGDAHTLCCTIDGAIFSWGNGDYGKLGHDRDPSKVPKLIDELENQFIVKVYCGHEFSIVLTANGQVFSWGMGNDYRLGHETEENIRYPKLIEALRHVKIIDLAVGSSHTLALSEQGDVYGWGRNDYYQISNNAENVIKKPSLISHHKDIKASKVVCGLTQSFIFSDTINFENVNKLKFILELSSHTFILLEKLLKLVYDQMIDVNSQTTQVNELIAIAVLDLLKLHFSYVIIQNKNPAHYCLNSNHTLISLIIFLSTNSNILKTVQEAAQQTMKIAWKLLLVTVDERIKTLSVILSGANNNYDKLTSGEKFLVDLLIMTLKSNNELQITFDENLDTNFECLSHLIQQLIETVTHLIENKLINVKNSNIDYEICPVLNLLLMIQRCIIGSILKEENVSKSILITYLDCLCRNCNKILNVANNILKNDLTNVLHVYKSLKSGLLDILLSEMVLNLILVHQEIQLFLNSCNLSDIFLEVLLQLDLLCKSVPSIYKIDETDLNFNTEDISSKNSIKTHYFITNSEFQNHVLENHHWILIKSFVYNIQDFKTDVKEWKQFLEENKGKDATIKLSTVPYNHLLLKILESYKIGTFWPYNIPENQITKELLPLLKVFLNTSRYIAYLLGFHAFCLYQSHPVQSYEEMCSSSNIATFLSSGLQNYNVPDPFQEDKCDVRSSNSITNNSSNDLKTYMYGKFSTDSILNSFIYSLAESRLLDRNVAVYLSLIEHYSKRNNFLTHTDFTFDHPVEEIGRVLHATIIFQQGIGYTVLETIRIYSGSQILKLPKILTDLIKLVHNTKWSLVKSHQDSNRSYKEICLPIMEKCRFLLYDVQAVVNFQKQALTKVNVLYKPIKFKMFTKQVINCNSNYKSRSIIKDPNKRNKSCDDFQKKLLDAELIKCKRLSNSLTLANNNSNYFGEELKENLYVILNELNKKYSFQAQKSYSQLMYSIVDFVTQNNEQLNVRILHTILLNHFERYQMRKTAFDLLTTLLSNNHLLSSILFAISNGFLAVLNNSNYFRDFDSSINCNFITPVQKIDLLLAKANLIEICTNTIHFLIKLTDDCHYSDFSKNLLKNRYFMTAYSMISIYCYNHNELSSILNNGILSSTLYILRHLDYEHNFIQRKLSVNPLRILSDDTVKIKKKISESSSMEIIQMFKKGTRVVRGPDWKWGDQDEPPPGEGSTLSDICDDGWVRVRWDNSSVNSYRMGKENKFDLALAPVSCSDCSDIGIVNEIKNERRFTFSDILRNTCMNFMLNIAINIGIHSNNMESIPLRNFCNLLNKMLMKSQFFNRNSWCSLTLILSICQNNRIKEILSQKIWIKSLLGLIEYKKNCEEPNFIKQLLAIKLLKVIISSWTPDSIEMQPILEKLLKILGHLALTCIYDKYLFENESKYLPLQQSYTSSLCQEMVNMIRHLHQLSGWNQMFNNVVIENLKSICDYLKTNSNLSLNNADSLDCSDQNFLVFGILNVLSITDSRIRIGSKVIADQINGTIVDISKKGKLSVQCNNTYTIKEFNKNNLILIEESDINFNQISFSKNLIQIWTSLLLLPIQNIYDFKRYLHSEYCMNINYLRNQQFQINLLNASQLIFQNQAKLRKLLKTQKANESDAISQSTIFHKILNKAVQPILFNKQYSLKELRFAALDLSQHLVLQINKNTKKNSKLTKSKLSPLTNPLINQLIEMGFSKTNIETGSRMFDNDGNVDLEKLIAWLLENSENSLKSSKYNFKYDEFDDSCLPQMLSSRQFKNRSDFTSNIEYAQYIILSIEIGMMVKSIKNFDQVKIGDIGIVQKIDNDDVLHNLNLQVYWQRIKSSVWVRFITVEILGFPNKPKTTEIKVGDIVKIRNDIIEPKHKWGLTDFKSIGIVKGISTNNYDVWVDFNNHPNWCGQISELKLINSDALICNTCNCSLLEQIVYKCKVCCHYVLCEPCFQSKKLHWHSFDRINESGTITFAGYPGRLSNVSGSSDNQIDDWNKCVQSIYVSSNKSIIIGNRFSGPWRSYGSRENPNWIRLVIHSNILISSLIMQLDPTDPIFLPSLIVISAGLSFTNLKKLNTVKVQQTVNWVTLLSNIEQYFSCIEISIIRSWNENNDCKVQNLIIKSAKTVLYKNPLVNFLTSDFEVSNDTNIYIPWQIDENNCKVLVWGLNDRDQLGSSINGSQIRIPTVSESLQKLRPIFITGGAKSLFIISQEGKLFSCGEGLHGRLGLGHHSNVSKPTLVSALSLFTVKKVSVHSCGRHSLAVTTDGKVFSWGECEDGNLGHGNRLSLDYPKQIDFFRNKIIREISCGTSHSAAITSNGELYTWGLGDYGRLGHGDDITQLQPKLVKALIGKHVIQVSCGGRDAQTLALLNTGIVYSWGDADFGKLGRNLSETNYLPEIIDTLSSTLIVSIACGAQFSIALSNTGEVYSWGRGDYFRLGHGSDQHVRIPTIIEGLKGKNVTKVAVGALHCLALTSDHQVYVWGDNDHGQQGDGSTNANKVPSLILGLDEMNINEISCGSSHCIIWYSLLPSDHDNYEPVIFDNVKDSLGASLLNFYDKETTSCNIENENRENKLNEPSTLGNQLISIESNLIKQQALQYLIQAIHIQQSRQCIIKSLASHKQVKELMINDQNNIDTEPEDISNKSSDSDENIPQILNMSSCSASISSRHSKMSSSAMSAVAATLTSNLDVLGSDIINSDNDDFICSINEEDIIDLLLLLKFSLCYRIECTNATETLSAVIIELCNSNNTMKSIVLEYCISQLEDIAIESKFEPPKPKSVVQESSHPYADDVTLTGQVIITDAESLRVEFDPRCSTEKRQDILQIEDRGGYLMSCCSGREWYDWCEIRIPGNELRWSFIVDGPANGWGWRFTVYPIMKTDKLSGLSDKQILCRPSIEFVMSLYNKDLFSSLDTHLFNRFITALANCSALNNLSTSQRIWSLKTLHNCLLEYFKTPNEILTILNFNCQKNSFAKLIIELPQMLLLQYEYEDFSVKSGRHLMYSEFFKVLVSLACDLLFDIYPAIRDSHKWTWFIRYCSAFKIVKSMINHTQLSEEFINDVQERISQVCFDNVLENVDYMDQDLFKREHDEQLLMWLNRQPNDWNLSTRGSTVIYGWGHNHRGQLGGIEGVKVKVPTVCEALSSLRISQIVGGEQTLFAVTVDGKVYCSGHGASGRLGIGSSESVQVPTLIESLVHVFIKKIAVNAGGHHCLALSNEYQVYSWGEGDDGKLGHGDRIYYDRPKLIETLKPYKIIDIACGGHHSAAISDTGLLFTWGKGRYGRLGHGDSEDQLLPKIVEDLTDYRVIDVACGCGDSQTLCITDDDNVWSWGDGDYGKLGRGGSEGCKIPIKIDSLAGLGVVKVECGSQFSIALTRSGSVYTWGKGDYHRLGHGSNEHVRRPKKISVLHGKKVTSIAIGSLHCIVCTDRGEVYTWGDNDEGQLGDGTTTAIPRPRLLKQLQNITITNVACGSAHTIAWSVSQTIIQRIIPATIPIEYDLLKEFPLTSSYCRLILLHTFSEWICPYISMFHITGPISLQQLRTILVYTVKESMFRKVIQTTMIRDKQHGPIIELNRLQIKRQKSNGGLAGVDGMKSVFGQMVSKLPLLKSDCLLLPHRVWKVKFVGESVDDCGGGFSESIAEMCDELQNGSLSLLITSPNGRDDTGTSRDCFILNSSLSSVLHFNMFRFLGVLMGIAVRTGSPLNLRIAEPIWKLLCGLELNPNDLTEIDRDFVPSLLCIKNMDVDEKEFEFLEMPFSTTSTNSVSVSLSSKYKYITLENRLEYIKLALDYRLHEFDEQVKAVRDGMSKVIPVPLLSLFTAYELETMVCGSPEIPLSMLKSVATYKGIESNSPLIQWFWEVMEEFSNQERSLFLRFVWGRTRLPRSIADFRGRDFVIQVMDKYNPPDYFLPESYTCFFLLKMPRYSCKIVLKEKLKYAIHFCKSIDTDEYARVAMTFENIGNGSEVNSINSEEPDLDIFYTEI